MRCSAVRHSKHSQCPDSGKGKTGYHRTAILMNLLDATTLLTPKLRPGNKKVCPIHLKWLYLHLSCFSESPYACATELAASWRFWLRRSAASLSSSSRDIL